MTRQYSKYLIGVADQFDPLNFSPVDEEIRIIKEKTDNFPLYFKSEIVISFLKEHAVQSNWADANPRLTELVTSGTLFTGSIESLFSSSRNNVTFQRDLEAYLKERFTENTPL